MMHLNLLQIVFVMVTVVQLFSNGFGSESPMMDPCPVTAGSRYRCVHKRSCPVEGIASSCGPGGVGVCCLIISDLSPQNCGIRHNFLRSKLSYKTHSDGIDDEGKTLRPTSKEFRKTSPPIVSSPKHISTKRTSHKSTVSNIHSSHMHSTSSRRLLSSIKTSSNSFISSKKSSVKWSSVGTTMSLGKRSKLSTKFGSSISTPMPSSLKTNFTPFKDSTWTKTTFLDRSSRYTNSLSSKSHFGSNKEWSSIVSSNAKPEGKYLSTSTLDVTSSKLGMSSKAPVSNTFSDSNTLETSFSDTSIPYVSSQSISLEPESFQSRFTFSDANTLESSLPDTSIPYVSSQSISLEPESLQSRFTFSVSNTLESSLPDTSIPYESSTQSISLEPESLQSRLRRWKDCMTKKKSFERQKRSDDIVEPNNMSIKMKSDAPDNTVFTTIKPVHSSSDSVLIYVDEESPEMGDFFFYEKEFQLNLSSDFNKSIHEMVRSLGEIEFICEYLPEAAEFLMKRTSIECPTKFSNYNDEMDSDVPDYFEQSGEKIESDERKKRSLNYTETKENEKYQNSTKIHNKTEKVLEDVVTISETPLKTRYSSIDLYHNQTKLYGRYITGSENILIKAKKNRTFSSISNNLFHLPLKKKIDFLADYDTFSSKTGLSNAEIVSESSQSDKLKYPTSILNTRSNYVLLDYPPNSQFDSNESKQILGTQEDSKILRLGKIIVNETLLQSIASGFQFRKLRFRSLDSYPSETNSSNNGYTSFPFSSFAAANTNEFTFTNILPGINDSSSENFESIVTAKSESTEMDTLSKHTESSTTDAFESPEYGIPSISKQFESSEPSMGEESNSVKPVKVKIIYRLKQRWPIINKKIESDEYSFRKKGVFNEYGSKLQNNNYDETHYLYRRKRDAFPWPEEAMFKREPQHIIGGWVENVTWPWVVAIYESANDKFVCGGTLIDELHVVSAAHCFIKIKDARRLTVVIGSLTRLQAEGTEELKRHRVRRLHIHEGFKPECYCNDIALLRLWKRLGPEHVPACLPERDPAGVGENTTILGWGDVNYGDRHSKGTFHLNRLDDVTISDPEDCRKIMSRIARMTLPKTFVNYYICAGAEGGKDACSGDSGGPLMHEDYDGIWSLIGVVSFGFKCGEPGVPGTYSKISYYLPWIRNIVEKPL